MSQLALFSGDTSTPALKPVNVSKVAQLSPFRYPGGKTWFVPYLRQWLKQLSPKPRLFVEPFAGGAICALSCASEGLADHVVMAELDDDVASVWQTALSTDVNWLIDKILEFPRELEQARAVIESDTRTTRERAFKTILRNRLLHGGILAPGSRMIRQGENGKGSFSRWYPETLCSRLIKIHGLKESITFVHGDAFDLFDKYRRRKTAAWFIDPPYTASKSNAGRRLYSHHAVDHRRLFRECRKMAGQPLMTYDDADEVISLAEEYSMRIDKVSMKNTHHQHKYELVITRDI